MNSLLLQHGLFGTGQQPNQRLIKIEEVGDGPTYFQLTDDGGVHEESLLHKSQKKQLTVTGDWLIYNVGLHRDESGVFPGVIRIIWD